MRIEFTFEAFLSVANAPTTSLIVMEADGSDPRIIASGLKLSNNEPGSPPETRPAWSPDNNRLAYSHIAAGTSVVDIARIDERGLPISLTDGEDPTWSPDGRTIAYRGGRSVGDAGVYLIGSDGDDPHRLTNVPGSGVDFAEPQWSPDGHRILFFLASSGNGDVWVVNADGSGEMMLVGGPENEYWAVSSPDASRLAWFRSREAPVVGRFVVAGPDGSDPVALEHPAVAGLLPVWSPDGSMLLGYSVDETFGPSATLVIVDAAGLAPAAALESTGNVGLASWQRLEQ